MSEVASNLDSYENFDAKQAAEEIATGDRKAPHVDVEADYEAAQQLSVSEVDRSGEGEKLAEAAVAPQFAVPTAQEPPHEAAVTGNPEDYKEMAHDLTQVAPGVGNVNDDLVQKAIEKGQPAQ